MIIIEKFKNGFVSSSTKQTVLVFKVRVFWKNRSSYPQNYEIYVKMRKKPRLFGIIYLNKKIFTKQKTEVFSMDNFTTNTYQRKRDIYNFSKKISEGSSKPKSKFITDMIYGISKSKDILLSNIADALDEK